MQISIRKKNEWLTTHADDSEFKSKLRLTGPGCSISAYWGFSIRAFFPGIDEEYTACYDSLDDYCSMLNHPETITITTNMGSLYVTCAVLSDAVQANLKLIVRLPFLYVFADMYGHVMAYIGTSQIGTTIYSIEDKNSEDLTYYQDGEEFGPKLCLPLDQSLLAVPIGSCLHIKGELVLTGSQIIPINYSIPTESHLFETGWDEDEEEALDEDEEALDEDEEEAFFKTGWDEDEECHFLETLWDENEDAQFKVQTAIRLNLRSVEVEI